MQFRDGVRRCQWLGVRTRNEIDREKSALKALRGDFETVSAAQGDLSERVNAVLTAVKA